MYNSRRNVDTKKISNINQQDSNIYINHLPIKFCLLLKDLFLFFVDQIGCHCSNIIRVANCVCLFIYMFNYLLVFIILQ